VWIFHLYLYLLVVFLFTIVFRIGDCMSEKALVMTVGIGVGRDGARSLAHGLCRSIKANNPAFILFCVTKESRKTVEEYLFRDFRKELSRWIENKKYDFLMISNPNDVEETFEEINEAVKKLVQDGYEIVVDFTSGTKAMSVAAVLVAIKNLADISYVQGKRREGVVAEGTERVTYLSPKQSTFEIIYEPMIRALFNSYQFKACLDLINRLKEKSFTGANQEKIDMMMRLTKGYYLWDLFEHEKAAEILIKMEIPPENKAFLGELSSKKREGKDVYKLLIADLINNAKRRIEEGKFDDAVARLYRTIELIAQYALKKDCGILTDDVDLNKVPESLRDKLESRRDDRGRIKIGLHLAYELLDALGHKLGRLFMEDKRLQDLLRRRNYSILAHGLEPVSEEVARELLEKTIALAKEIIDPKRLEVYIKNSKFPKIGNVISA